MGKLDKENLQYFRESSAEQKLQILRHEMMAQIEKIESVEILLRKMYLENPRGSDPELDFLFDTLSETTSHMKEILDTLT